MKEQKNDHYKVFRLCKVTFSFFFCAMVVANILTAVCPISVKNRFGGYVEK